MKNETKSLSAFEENIENSTREINLDTIDEQKKKEEKEKKKQAKEQKKAEKRKKQKNPIVEQKKEKNDELSFEDLKNYNPVPAEFNEEDLKGVDYKKLNLNTELVLNCKIFNKHIDYLPSDFTSKLVKKYFILSKRMNLPKDTKVKVTLHPNDTEKFLKVIVAIDSYYKNGLLINKTKVFEPFWILGFGTYSLIISQERPSESKYRINNMHAFAYAQTQKINKKKISKKYTNKSKSYFQVEQDFIRARENKNWYLQQYVEALNKIKNVEWDCYPKISINWNNKIISFDLYLKISRYKNGIRKIKWVHVDHFIVKASEVLDIPKDTKIVDIDAIMYLVALNAIYKNIKIFSYKTLYESYKILSAEVLSRGFKLKPISPANLATLKIVDFSTHFVCKNSMFNDSILHIMNLMSSHEEYYRMKYAYTVQKNPSLLFSDFIVREFKSGKVDELKTIIKNQEEKYWDEQLRKIEELNNNQEVKNKDFYINNYNILQFSNNAYKDVESYLMSVIKGEKDEISRISKLGQEMLSIEEDPRFTKQESAELRKVAKKLDENYRDLFASFESNEFKKLSKAKPIKLEKVRKKKKKNKHKDHNEAETTAVENNNSDETVAGGNNE